MEGVLNQVLSGHKTTHKQLEKNNTLLGSILGVQSNILNVEKERLKQDRRDAQAEKRKEADSKKKDNQLKKILDAINKGGKNKDTEKNIFEKIFDGIKGVGGGLMNAILASLGLGAGVSLIDKILGSLGLGKKGAKSKGFFKDLKRSIKKFTIGIQKNIRSVFGKGGFFGKMFGKGSFLGKTLGKFKPGALIKGSGIFAAITSGITEFFDSGSLTDALFASVGGGAGAIAGGALGSLLGPVGTVVGAALGSWIGTELTGIVKEQLDKVPFLKDTFAFIDAEFNKMLDSFKNLFSAVQTTFGQFTDMVDVLFRSVQRFYTDAFQPIFDGLVSFYAGAWTKLVEGFTFVGDWFSSTFEPILIKVGDALNPIISPLKQLADTILPPLEAGLKGLGEFLKPFLNPGKFFVDGVKDKVEGAGNFFKGIADYFRDYADRKQLGGFVGTVPNQGGNGDRFGAMLSPGSVVLNQTAAGMMQNGGMVPTMLEQGEQVYGPNDPTAGMALMMNSMIPRFQTGGVVQTDGTSQTGSGFQPKGAKDYKGRPVVFSKGAAEAWAKMGKNVRGQDVNSSKRSASYNSTVGGVSNSNHLYGEGVDVQTGSPSWHFLKDKGSNYGWNFNNYLGPEGWHFDYKGGGIKKDGNEKGIAKIASQATGALAMLKTAVPEGMKATGKAASEMFSMFKGNLGSAASLLGTAALGPLGALMSFVSGYDTNESSNTMDVSKQSTPLTGDQNTKGEEMYNYIKGKGYNDSQSRALVANMIRESSLNAKARSGDDGGAGGLFQWKGSRQTNQVKSLVNSGNWKGQIDYALQEDVGPRYKSETATMTAHQAADWWDRKWERSADGAHSSMRHGQILKGMKFQQGGIAQVRGAGSANTANMVIKSQENFAKMIAQGVTPVVVPVPMGGGGGGGGASANSADTPFPSLPAEDNSVVSMEYKYRITMGASV